jgi:hypothetical protein
MYTTKKGGLKKRDKTKLLFDPILDMMSSPGCVFNVLTVSSLKGFMVKMDIREQFSEYTQPNPRTNSKFDTPVTHFLLKFAIVSPVEETISKAFKSVYFNGNKDIKKATDSKLDFFNEAKLQQNIWIDSIVGGRFPICPSVANLSFFKANAPGLLNYIKNTPDKSVNPADNAIISGKLNDLALYLETQVSIRPRFELGMIVQNLIEQSATLSDFLRSAQTPRLKQDAVVFAGAQMIRLFLNSRIIHLDLHLGNILVSKVDKGCNSYIIDFGRILNFQSQILANITNIINSDSAEKLQILTNTGIDVVAEWTKIENLIQGHRTDVNGPLIVKEIIDLLARIDLSINTEVFGLTTPQMSGFMDQLNPTIYTEIWNKFMLINTPGTGLTRITINKMIKDKEIELINDDLFRSGAYNNTPFGLAPPVGVQLGPPALGPPACDPNAGWGSSCSIAGGKKNKKRRTHKGCKRRKTHKKRKTYKKR